MPQRFPEHGWLLTFAEACAMLPDDVQPYAHTVGVVATMAPLALWEDSPTPHVPRPVPPGWLRKARHNPQALHMASIVHVQPREGFRVLTLYFDPKQVEAACKRFTPPKKGGRPGAKWHEIIAGAGGFDEALGRLPALPGGLEREFTDDAGEQQVRHGTGAADFVTRKHFMKVLRKRRNPKAK